MRFKILFFAALASAYSILSLEAQTVTRNQVLDLRQDLSAFREKMLMECFGGYAKDKVNNSTACFQGYKAKFNPLGVRIEALIAGLSGGAYKAGVAEMRAGVATMGKNPNGGAIMQIVDALNQKILPNL